MINNLFKIKFSDWCLWKDKNSLDKIEHTGIYILAKCKSNIFKKVDLYDKNVVYIGETCSSLKKRLRQFNRAAFKGLGGHSGGASYRKYFNDRGEDLYVAVFPVVDLADNVKHLFIRYIERKMILDYALKNGSQPILNKK